MIILAIDFGEKRVGMAISREGYFAQKYKTVSLNEFFDQIKSICGEEAVEKILVGLPRTLRREIGPQAEKTKKYIEKLKQKVEIPVIEEDETLTTAEAHEKLREAGVKLGEEKEIIDQEAARILLQDYLDSIKKIIRNF